MAITQDDCITVHRAEKKRKAPTGPSGAQPPRYCLVRNTITRAPQRNTPSGRWVIKPPQQQGAVMPPIPQQQQSGPRPNNQQTNRANGNNRCFTCGSLEHFARACPRNQKHAQGQNLKQNNQGKGKKQVMQVRQGKINFTTLAELPEGAPIMPGIFSINDKPTVILFDFGATHSFISDKCGARVGLESSQATAQYMITTPGGKIASNQILRHVPIKLGSKLVKTDLISLSLEGMDIILGMDWMTQHRVLLDISS